MSFNRSITCPSCRETIHITRDNSLLRLAAGRPDLTHVETVCFQPQCWQIVRVWYSVEEVDLMTRSGWPMQLWRALDSAQLKQLEDGYAAYSPNVQHPPAAA